MRTATWVVATSILLALYVQGSLAGSFGLLIAIVGGVVWYARRSRPALAGAARVRGLAAAFPEDPLESDAIVQAWAPHAHDADALARLRESYDRTRRRLLADGDVEEAEEYLRSARTLAVEAPELVDRAIAEHGRAKRVIDSGDETAEDVLLAADERLQGARDALRKDEERPLDALRLASEAERVATVPGELAALAADVEQTREAVAVASERHAERALAEVRGLPELAQEEVERARALAANDDYDDALEALATARTHVDRISSHLARLERAAATARDRLHLAEAAIDNAKVEDAERARALVEQARRELDAERPNWLEIVALAERALRVTGERHVEDAVDGARRRARGARDEAFAWALTNSRRAVEMLPLARAADAALAQAEAVTDEGLAISAFQRAERLALAALERV